MADQGQDMFQEQPDQGSEGKPTSMFEVGGRQYDAEAAKTKIENADKFIEQLKSERQQDSERLQSLEDQIRELTRHKDTSAKLDELLSKREEQEPSKPAEQTKPPQLDEAAIIAKLREQMDLENQTEVRARNMSSAVQAASKRYGEDWRAKLREQGKEMGMDDRAIQEMAQTSPQAFAKLFGLTSETKRSEAAPTGGSSMQAPTTREEEKPSMFSPQTSDLMKRWNDSAKKVADAHGIENYGSSFHALTTNKYR